MIEFQDIEPLIHYALAWVERYVFSWGALLQLATIITIPAVAWVASSKISIWISKAEKHWVKVVSGFIQSHIHLSLREIILLVLLPFMMGVSVLIANVATWPTTLISVASNLITAWAFIRVSSSIIQIRFLSITLAFSIWSIAALNILGWLDPVINILDQAAITLGTLRISLLLIIKGTLIFGLLIWGAGVLSRKLERILDNLQEFSPSQKVLFHKLARILLFVTAVLLGLKSIGIDLTALAVFTGALGIGIGFGLQKVFANIISGFILLMDKSIKPGDVIVVGDTYGWVNCLGTRHVSILTRDGKEHLIPNETLITEPVENWSYSDNKVRVRVPIGVSYNSDIHQVKRLLLGVAASIPRILKHPAPNCLIIGFGDSSVDFEMRVWIEDPANGIRNLRSAVYEAVWDVFKEHNIEIPFPQRDLHIRSTVVPKDSSIVAEKG